MAFDGVLSAPTLLLAPTSLTAPAFTAGADRFRYGEGIPLLVGALSLGAMTGVTLLLGFGRIAPWIAPFGALAAYGCAMFLARHSLRDVIASRGPVSTALFGVHVAALLAAPFSMMLWTANSWQFWLGLPTALLSLGLLLTLTRALPGVVYRSSVLVWLLASIVAYQWLAGVVGA
jgi:hypothetical protein